MSRIAESKEPLRLLCEELAFYNVHYIAELAIQDQQFNTN